MSTITHAHATPRAGKQGMSDPDVALTLTDEYGRRGYYVLPRLVALALEVELSNANDGVDMCGDA